MDDLKNARNLVKGSGLAVVSNIINGLIGFLTSLLIAKTLGTERYGEFSLTLAVVGMFMAASSLGIGQATAKYIGEFLGQKRYAAAAGVWHMSARMTAFLFAASSILLYLFAGSIAEFFAKDIRLLLRLMSLGLFFGGAMAFLLASFQGFQLFAYYNLTEILHNSIKLIAVAFLLMVGMGAVGAILGIVIGYIVTVMTGVFLLFSGVHLTTKEYAVRPSKLVRMGLPLAAAGYLLFLTTRGSTYLLGIFASSTEVGVYSAALIFGYELFVLSDALNSAFFPVFSSVHGGGGKDRFAAFFEYTLKFGSVLVFPLIAYLGMFAPKIVGLLLGANYAQSAEVLRILLSLGLFYFLFSTISSALIAMGKPKKVLLLATIPLATVVIAGNLLIPRYGVNGAAVTDSIAFAFAAAVAAWTLKKEMGVGVPLRTIGGSAISALGMGVFLFYATPSVKNIVSVVEFSLVSLVVYAVLLLFLGAFEKKDVDLLENIFIGNRLYPLVRYLCAIARKLLALKGRIWKL